MGSPRVRAAAASEDAIASSGRRIASRARKSEAESAEASEVEALRRRVADLEREVAEHEAARAELRNLQLVYEVMGDKGSELIARLSSDGTILDASPNHRRILADFSEDLVGVSILELAHPDDREHVSCLLSRMTRSEEPARCAMRIVNGNGDCASLEGTLIPLRTPGGENAIVSVMRDVSVRVTAEQALSDSFDELERCVEDRTRELLDSNERMRIHFEHSPIGISITEPHEGRVTRNRAFAELLGCETGELSERLWTELVHPDDRGRCRAVVEDALARRAGDFELDMRMIATGGAAIEVHAITGIQWGEGDVPESLITTVENISQRKEAEREIAAREARYRAVAESAFDLVGELDHEGQLVYLSESVRQIFGYTPQQYCDLEWADGIHPEDRAHVNDNVALLLAEGRAGPFIHRHRDAEGDWCWLETSAHRYTAASGRLHTVFASRDLSERYRMEAELRRRAEFIEGIIDHMPALVFQLDEKGRLVDAAGSIMQRDPGLGPDLVALRGLDVDEESRGFVARALAGEAVSFEANGSRNGVLWNFLIYLAPDTDRGLGALGFALDVTPLRDAERRVRQAERLSALGTLAAGIAHEINNPIGSVLMAADFVRNLDESAEGRATLGDALDDIVREARRCGDIVRSLLCYAGHEAGGRELMSSNELVRAARDVELGLADEVGASIELHLTTQPAWVSANRIGMTQVISNLIRNALQSNSDGGRVEVVTSRDAQWARISVLDQGRGMSAEALRRAFDPFYTTHRTRGGTGLGLALADAMVSEHGGSIRAESREGEGSRFVIELPVQSRSGRG